MLDLSNMPKAGLVVIALILVLFALAVVLLFVTYLRYKRIANMLREKPDRDNIFLRFVVNSYAEAYKKNGNTVNTPAIIADAVSSKLGGLLLCERFLNNAVSLFVTLGLFGTFLGLSLSVSSLTELISYSNTSEWLSVLDSVGGGLMSSLSGMGVAFYTSLVGVACSILLTILRSIFSPQAEREKLEARLELWLDHTVAPTLPTEAPTDDATLVRQLVMGMQDSAAEIDKTLKETTNDMKRTMLASRELLGDFNKTVDSFNSGVRDFSEFNYNLRGTVERMDVTVRDLVGGLRELARIIGRGDHS